MGSRLLSVAMGCMALGAVGFGHAEELQLLSLQEEQPGRIVATTNVFAASVPDASAFQLRLDEKHIVPAQEVKLSAIDSPRPKTSIVFSVDSNNPTRLQKQYIRDSLTTLLSSPSPQLNVALYEFGAEVKKLHDFSNNSAELIKETARLGLTTAHDDKTRLYDALKEGLAALTSRQEGSKRLLLITAGKDKGSSVSDQVIISGAQAQGLVIDAVEISNGARRDSELLQRLIKKTGGQYLIVSNKQELSKALEGLLSLSPAQTAYAVVFHYAPSKDGRLANSVRLDFAPPGAGPVISRTVDNRLSAPDIGTGSQTDSSVPTPGNKVLLWVLGAALALGVIYMLYKGMGEKRPPPPPPPPPPLPPSPPRKERDAPKAPRGGTKVLDTFPPPGQGRPAALLHCISGPTRGRQFPIDKAVYHIGASEKNELQLSDERVSGRHARVTYESGHLYLSDSESRNGTFLNGTRIVAPTVLSPNDQIRVGSTIFELLKQTNERSQTITGAEPFVP
ncbi:FHA domain-containing protein [Nitrosospira sp. Is2]|uniref:FHA domain-containing protein n=1 Tax=Nitrosospira sp. Is2 TaxID=3080532 RepID=UPI0029554B87|nr:FHA domain-containing protein [Nitrosospira sp. Is2]WON73505.1 FHA domain-containing protein [Nitrosospira sp. Is2]